MCERLKDEALMTWLVRVCCKHPSALLSLVCMAATCTMYADNRASRAELTEAYKEAVVLNERTVAQLQKLDEHMARQDENLRQLDDYHKQACMQGK